MKKCMLLLLLLVLAVAVGCGQQAEKKEMQEITIGLMPDTDSLPFIIAQEKGFFAEAGVKVNLQQFKSAMDRDSALQSGNLDGAVSDLLAVAFAKAGGFDVKATSFTDGSYKLVAGAAEAAADVKALQGKEVAVSKKYDHRVCSGSNFAEPANAKRQHQQGRDTANTGAAGNAAKRKIGGGDAAGTDGGHCDS